MEIPKENIIFRIFDFVLSPFMWFLNRFKFPVQESHPWNVKKYKWKGKGVRIAGNDSLALFGKSGISKYLGLYHMPIFGGLTRYVVIMASGFDKYWLVGWEGQIQSLPIKQDKIMLLVGKNGFTAYGLGDNARLLKLRIIGYGTLGDNKYKGIRLF